MKFVKKPVVVEAEVATKEMDIETLEGTMHANKGDWIITGVKGEQYPCKPDIFRETYEPAEPGDWKQRVQREYRETKDRYEKLHKMCNKYEAGTLDFTPNCSLSLLKRQRRAMGEYLNVLEIRAEIEGLEL